MAGGLMPGLPLFFWGVGRGRGDLYIRGLLYVDVNVSPTVPAPRSPSDPARGSRARATIE